MKKKIFASSLIIVILLIFSVAGQCFYTVEPDQYANTVRFSKTVKTVSEPGLYVKFPIIDDVKYFPILLPLLAMFLQGNQNFVHKVYENANHLKGKVIPMS